MSQTKQNTDLQGLYVITDPSLSSVQTILKDVTQAIQGGAKIVQFRDKTTDFASQLFIAKQLKTLCDQHQALLIINDSVELAKQSQAHGIHIGKNDREIESVRRALGSEVIIGVSCYNDIDLALQMQALGADYVAFGRFFPSKTKPNAPQADIQTLIDAKQRLSVPIVAIGGIEAQNAEQLVKSGAHSLAVIQGVFAQENIEAAARQISQFFES